MMFSMLLGIILLQGIFGTVCVVCRIGLCLIYKLSKTIYLPQQESSVRSQTKSSRPHLSSNWACLNTDGSNKFEGGSAMAGGTVKNCEDGLTLLQERGFGSILTETDNLEAAKAIQ
ncbi:hypothetical protein PVK06_013663 [Gossypium arboreum]|uniref:Uncharacterized protein n=1 Tax=Gossypium arboreum TaxID=29729 RepID=A0ABR0PS92_GOSAR|nr:hypothetical protein PVK06_013663 [Gossypium arboreum]